MRSGALSACPRAAGAAARPGRAGEGLGDVQPAVGVGAVGLQREVGAVRPLGDQQAEVERRPGDALRGVLGAPGPRSPSGRRELHPERLGRRRQPVRGVGEVAGADAECGDVPQPRRWPAGGGRARRRRPGRAPRSPSAGRWPSRRRSSAARTRAARARRAAAASAAASSSRPARQRASSSPGRGGARSRGLVDERVEPRKRPARRRPAKPSGSVSREQRLLVGPGEVRDLVGDGPALGRCRRQPGGVLEIGDDPVEGVGLWRPDRRAVLPGPPHPPPLRRPTDRPYGQPEV